MLNLDLGLCKDCYWSITLYKSGQAKFRFRIIVRSIIDYPLPTYADTLKVTELARLERIPYKAAKIVTGALHFTNQDKLNLDLGWESIKQRIDFLGLCFFHKIHRQETRPLIRSCMSKLDRDKVRITRSKGGYLPFKNYGNTFLKSFLGCGATSINRSVCTAGWLAGRLARLKSEL